MLTATVVGLLLIILAAVLLVRQPSFVPAARILTGAADAARLRRHVEFLTRDAAPRDVQHPENLEKAAAFVERELSLAGARVERQTYAVRGRTFSNVIGRLGPDKGEPFVVGAHYDAFGETNENPGADDNASGVAGLLETGKLLGPLALEHPLVLVAFCTEEPPHYGSDGMGSAVHAASLRSAGARIRGMISLEMIGFYAAEQPWPSRLFALAYPTRGDFIAVVGRWADHRLARALRLGINAASQTAAYSYSGPRVSGVEASDHSSYWAEGFSAVMVTDTAFLRNPNYHAPTDTAETLSYERMSQVVTGIANAAGLLCGAGGRQLSP